MADHSEGMQVVQVVASLEGMRIIATRDRCELHEYNFEENAWKELDASSRPLSRDKAEQWLQGWNRLDRFTALNCLIATAV